MNFNRHFNLKGQHAIFGASNYHWINYDIDKAMEIFEKKKAAARGTILHKFASDAIDICQHLPDEELTLNMYVNDCIDYAMTTEQILYYSPNFFGTADAISYRDGKLLIFDLKTGTEPAHIEQLLVYTALFCLEYKVKPSDIDICLRLYQNNKIIEYIPSIEDIAPIMDKIVTFDRLINEYTLLEDE